MPRRCPTIDLRGEHHDYMEGREKQRTLRPTICTSLPSFPWRGIHPHGYFLEVSIYLPIQELRITDGIRDFIECLLVYGNRIHSQGHFTRMNAWCGKGVALFRNRGRETRTGQRLPRVVLLVSNPRPSFMLFRTYYPPPVFYRILTRLPRGSQGSAASSS